MPYVQALGLQPAKTKRRNMEDVHYEHESGCKLLDISQPSGGS